MNFGKFLRTLFLTEHLGWMLPVVIFNPRQKGLQKLGYLEICSPVDVAEMKSTVRKVHKMLNWFTGRFEAI